MTLVFTLFFLLALIVAICLRASEADWGRGWRNTLDGLVRLFWRFSKSYCAPV